MARLSDLPVSDRTGLQWPFPSRTLLLGASACPWAPVCGSAACGHLCVWLCCLEPRPACGHLCVALLPMGTCVWICCLWAPLCVWLGGSSRPEVESSLQEGWCSLASGLPNGPHLGQLNARRCLWLRHCPRVECRKSGAQGSLPEAACVWP